MRLRWTMWRNAGSSSRGQLGRGPECERRKARNISRAAVYVWAFLCLCACDPDNPASPAPGEDPGLWILDSVYTLDAFPYRADACAEVFPTGSASADSVPAGSAASLRLIVTSCYALTVRVIDSDSDTVRSFSTRFAIFNRTEEEKNRGVTSFAAWDGRDDEGNRLGPGRYLWRMDFDFGLGRMRRYRADIWL